MPNLIKVSLSLAFNYKFNVIITGGALLIELSGIDIGALHRFFRRDEKDNQQ